MNHRNKIGVIVLGGHIQALGIVRTFGRLGIPVVIIDNTKVNISRHSRYCKRYYYSKDKDLPAFLLNLGDEGVYPGWLIFPTNDYHVKILSQNKLNLGGHFKITTDKWETVRLFYNKKETYQLAAMLEIPMAATYYPKDEEELKKIQPVYPCILKPAVMHDFYRQVKKKVFVCKNPEQLICNYRLACNYIPKEEIIIQNIIPGPSRNQYSACFLFLNGQSYVLLTATRMRQHPIDFGNATTYAETVDIPVLKDYGEKILKAADYNGICEIEFKKDETDGEFKLLEINARTWKWHGIAEKSSTPFLEKYYHYLIGENIEPVNSFKSASFRHATTDLPVQIKLLFYGYRYALRIKRPNVRAVWSCSDIMPAIFELLYLPFLIFKR